MTYYPDCKVLVSIFVHAWMKIKKEAAPSSGLWTILFQTVNSFQDFLMQAVLKSSLLSA